jgi:hypothetical protein
MTMVGATEEELVRGIVQGYDSGREGLAGELERMGILSGRRFVSLKDEYAAYLVAKAVGGEKAAPRRVVIEGDHSLTLQVCAQCKTPVRRPKYFALDCAPDDESFDALACVIFEPDWSVFDSYMIMRPTLPRLAVPGKKKVGHRLPIGGSWRSDPAILALEL